MPCSVDYQGIYFDQHVVNYYESLMASYGFYSIGFLSFALNRI
jgi:hypothetical protein